MEVLDQLAANPVSTRKPTEASGSGLQTLTTEEEDKLSSRYGYCKLHGQILQYYVHACIWELKRAEIKAGYVDMGLSKENS